MLPRNNSREVWLQQRSDDIEALTVLKVGICRHQDHCAHQRGQSLDVGVHGAGDLGNAYLYPGDAIFDDVEGPERNVGGVEDGCACARRGASEDVFEEVGAQDAKIDPVEVAGDGLVKGPEHVGLVDALDELAGVFPQIFQDGSRGALHIDVEAC